MATSENLRFLGELPYFPHLRNCWLSNEGFILSDQFGGPAVMKRLENFVPREDDVFVVSFPKTGTTWLQEVVYLVGTECDFESARSKHLLLRAPFMDFLSSPADLSNMPLPRFMKLHIPYSMIPKAILESKCKIVYVMRNPKDTVVSYYHFCRRNKFIGFDSDLATFVEFFVKGKVLYGPYWKHYLEFWERRNQENIHITTYEQMTMDLSGEVRKIAKFLGKELPDSQVEELTKFCSFDQMSKNVTTNPDLLPTADKYFKYDENKTPVFMRKGQVGDWKNHFNEEMNKKLDKSIEEHFAGTGLDFVYEM